ncbi:MAG: hypothetical protein FD153_1959 [Rhodospirillaceae bacterium]|nr:MAG: hypothetical protein FD153_1959 [Rhodospirillaceae bacterium]
MPDHLLNDGVASSIRSRNGRPRPERRFPPKRDCMQQFSVWNTFQVTLTDFTPPRGGRPPSEGGSSVQGEGIILEGAGNDSTPCRGRLVCIRWPGGKGGCRDACSANQCRSHDENRWTVCTRLCRGGVWEGCFLQMTALLPLDGEGLAGEADLTLLGLNAQEGRC